MEVEQERLEAHVARLAGEPRPAESSQLERARAYVTDLLEQSGWEVARHPFTGHPEDGPPTAGISLTARHPACRDDALPRFCLGAHLDSRPDSPGADDNGSAVAALLEVARLLPGLFPEEPAMEIELVAFDLEELGMLGGLEQAALYQTSGTDLRGMVSLEMLGFATEAANSQMLPKPLVGLYPDVGNFIAVIGNQRSAVLTDVFAAGLDQIPGLPVETLAVPQNGELLQATRLSDHSPFWDAGYPALMVTDTSFLRNPHYHTASDTP
ncbi:MAG: M28 family peptidase [Planctomycetaceae bacterium]|nr:M28 family peptidase [Planctomycetaceae bacterium]